MGRRKKGKNLRLFLIALALIAAGWLIAVNFGNSSKETKQTPAVAQNEPAPVFAKPVAGEEAKTLNGPQFVLETYRSDKHGFELQYPVLADGKNQCPKLRETGDGFSVGIFSFTVYDPAQKSLADFIRDELQGMEIETQTALAVAGQPAAKIDYQTSGMGFNGSSVFLERNGEFFEFGLLVNTAPSSCGGQVSYEDTVYQSVISSLKFIR